MRWEQKPALDEVAMAYGLLFAVQGLLMLLSTFEKNENNAGGTINKIPFFKYGFMIMISSLVYFVFLRLMMIW